MYILWRDTQAASHKYVYALCRKKGIGDGHASVRMFFQYLTLKSPRGGSENWILGLRQKVSLLSIQDVSSSKLYSETINPDYFYFPQSKGWDKSVRYEAEQKV
jgi:hypothetical protein